jgi:hypothetical protein
MSFGLDLSDIQTDAIRFEEQISTLVARDPEASAYVRKLEEQVSEAVNSDDGDDDEEDSIFNADTSVGTGPLPSAESLIRGVEELLRKQREDGEHNKLSDDEEDE